MLAIILSACPSFLAHAACLLSRSRRPISQSAHPACCRMSEGATPSSELRVESFPPLVSPGQARKGVSFEMRIAQLRALCEQHGHALPTAEHGSDLKLDQLLQPAPHQLGDQLSGGASVQ